MLKVCIQAEAGSRDKSIYNEKTLESKGTQRISQPYPYPYGFILKTIGADGDNVDCYIFTRQKLKSGTIVECEPIGLLEQQEGDEIDHKILARLPQENVKLSQPVLEELQSFIHAIFAAFPGEKVSVGPLRSRVAALDYLQQCDEKSAR